MIGRLVALGVLALSFVAAGVAALWFGGVLMLEIRGTTTIPDDELQAWELRYVWLNMLQVVGGPLIGAGFIAGIAVLALVVHGRSVHRG